MSDFFRFPTTPHLFWLAREGVPRDGKVLSPREAEELLSGVVVVEEKLDGANLGFSLAPDGELRAQNRGQYLSEPLPKQFMRVPPWLAQHELGLRKLLRPELILFGEWCAARHSLGYDRLPDWFLLFDVYDRFSARFWTAKKRDALAAEAGVFTVPIVSSGPTTLGALRELVNRSPSLYRTGLPMEGVVVRRESREWCEARAKLIHPDFVQAIDNHWRKLAIEWNRVVWTDT